jgi:hypothetical protein
LRTFFGCDSEIHFSEMNNRTPVELAKSWLHEGNQNSKIKQIIRGIEIAKLDSANFALNKENSVISRFARSTILYGLRRYGGHCPVLGAVFFDSGDLENDPSFSTTLIRKIRQDTNLSVVANSVDFINSDHRLTSSNPHLSNLIQFTDLAIGASRQCMEMASRKSQRTEVSQVILPTIEKITIGRPYTATSSGQFTNSNFNISFFPGPENSGLDSRGSFYTNRFPEMSRTSSSLNLEPAT